MTKTLSFIFSGVSSCARLFILFCLPAISFAEYQRAGFGGVATDVMQPVNVVHSFLSTACLVLGAAFLFATIVKYFEHRRSPLMVPISTVIFLFIAGLALLSLPVLSYFKGWK